MHADFLTREILRHQFSERELKLLICVVRQSRWCVARIEQAEVEVFEARFDRRLFCAWTGLRSDHVLRTLEHLEKGLRVLVPKIWRDGVYQIYAQSDRWKVQELSWLQDVQGADALASVKVSGVDRRGDCAPDAGAAFESTVAALPLSSKRNVRDLDRVDVLSSGPGRDRVGELPSGHAESEHRVGELPSGAAVLPDSGPIAARDPSLPQIIGDSSVPVIPESGKLPCLPNSLPQIGEESPQIREEQPTLSFPELGKNLPD